MSDIRRRAEEVLADHATTFVDQDGDLRCDCDKWLEPGEYEWPKHVAWALDDARLLAETPKDTLIAFARWLLKDELGDGREEEFVDRFLADT